MYRVNVYNKDEKGYFNFDYDNKEYINAGNLAYVCYIKLNKFYYEIFNFMIKIEHWEDMLEDNYLDDDDYTYYHNYISNRSEFNVLDKIHIDFNELQNNEIFIKDMYKYDYKIQLLVEYYIRNSICGILLNANFCDKIVNINDVSEEIDSDNKKYIWDKVDFIPNKLYKPHDVLINLLKKEKREYIILESFRSSIDNNKEIYSVQFTTTIGNKIVIYDINHRKYTIENYHEPDLYSGSIHSCIVRIPKEVSINIFRNVFTDIIIDTN